VQIKSKSKIIVIMGPTASGKSDLAVRVAKKFNGEIVSADSRQVYKGMDIGTGKITTREMRNVPHYLLDVVSPKKKFSASEYKKLAEKAIDKILARGKLPIICGGTGHYIAALLGEQTWPEVPPNPKLRKQLEKKTAPELFEMLSKLDPRRAKEIDRHNPRRLVRAIEIAKAIGVVPKRKSQSASFENLKIGIKIPGEILKERINKRLEKRINPPVGGGMLSEAKRLHKAGLSYKRMKELGLEYGRMADFLEGKISKEEMVELLKKEIWQYAKRQMTWFKRDKDIKWFTLSEVERSKKIEKEVKKFLS
jgi:tRNA dimethylallyltransferase